jgi:hypothetical protein
MDIEYPKESRDLILRGLKERARRLAEKKEGEEGVKNLKDIKEDYYLDLESDAYLKSAVDVLFKEYPRLKIEKKRKVMDRLGDMINKTGPPEKSVKVLVDDLVNEVWAE